MKTQSIVIFIFFAIGCQQGPTKTSAAAVESMLRPDPATLLLPPMMNIDSAPFVHPPNASVVDDVTLRAVDQPIIDAVDLSVIRCQANNMIRRITDGVKKMAADVAAFGKKILSIPLARNVIRILLLPATAINYIVRILLLPLRIGKQILKLLSYPVQEVLHKLFNPNPSLPEFVYDAPTGSHMFAPPMFTS